MTSRERYGPTARLCCNCKHYYQHYIRINQSLYMETNDGHCVVKHRAPFRDRKPNDNCIDFDMKEVDA